MITTDCKVTILYVSDFFSNPALSDKFKTSTLMKQDAFMPEVAGNCCSDFEYKEFGRFPSLYSKRRSNRIAHLNDKHHAVVLGDGLKK